MKTKKCILIFTVASAVLLCLALPLACLAEPEWASYENSREGYSLALPAQLKVYLNMRKDIREAAENRLPFDYLNFRPERAAGSLASFELGVGVHWNRDNLGTREFADKKDEGLRTKGARIEILRQAEVTVDGMKGVRDDFRIRQPEGWKTYSRVIIPSGSNFFVFLGTLGDEKADPGYELVFQKILDSFEARR
jgi:hypothetical protein